LLHCVTTAVIAALDAGLGEAVKDAGHAMSPGTRWLLCGATAAYAVIGLIAGWLAGKISRGRGFGCITDIILGIVGSFIGGWIFMRLGIWGGGFLYSLAAATVGAVLLVFIAHLFSGGDR